MDALTFWIGGLTAVTGGMMAVTRRNAVASVIWLVFSFLGMAVLFFGMDAGFIGVIQVLVYAGAIMVLFVFVIMFLNLTPTGLLRIDRPKLKVAGLAAGAGVVALVCAMVLGSEEWTRRGTEAAIAARSPGGKLLEGDMLPLSDQLFVNHLLPFEIASILLLVAIVGAVALTKKKV